jgi:hypothetical protein
MKQTEQWTKPSTWRPIPVKPHRIDDSNHPQQRKHVRQRDDMHKDRYYCQEPEYGKSCTTKREVARMQGMDRFLRGEVQYHRNRTREGADLGDAPPPPQSKLDQHSKNTHRVYDCNFERCGHHSNGQASFERHIQGHKPVQMHCLTESLQSTLWRCRTSRPCLEANRHRSGDDVGHPLSEHLLSIRACHRRRLSQDPPER